jgi:multisubunit Na+/H+ antiporter MnhG subunit
MRIQEMSDVAQSRAIRQAANQISLAIACAAVVISILLPICAVIVGKATLKMQAEQMRQQMSQPR